MSHQIFERTLRFRATGSMLVSVSVTPLKPPPSGGGLGEWALRVRVTWWPEVPARTQVPQLGYADVKLPGRRLDAGIYLSACERPSVAVHSRLLPGVVSVAKAAQTSPKRTAVAVSCRRCRSRVPASRPAVAEPQRLAYQPVSGPPPPTLASDLKSSKKTRWT